MLEDKIISILENKKGYDILKLDVSDKTTLADTFIIVSGTSSTHVKALSDNVEEDLKKEKIYAKKIEGYQEGRWILMDYGDVVVHIFHPDERELYNLEDLWQNMNQLDN